ncbi:hypothetical protein M3A74_06320 [Corynebacterium appendicis]|uniref:hypothetical protein n=1 Tax=Corynebacterium appendicis TaxID=163202 RepID=UPI00223C06A2|nr:hypothetical protein [Corynebacterium appendicis]MCT1684429.1 hypothetical protein [Corynebacterium appendicis]
MKRRVVAAALSVALVAGAVPAHAGVERPVDDRSSIKPLFELSSPAHSSEHSSMATNEKLREEWAEAARKGFFSLIIESIYGLDIPDGYEERMAAEDGNVARYDNNGSANAVLGSSLKWDMARGQQLGTALNWWIAAGVLAGLLGGVVAADQAGLIALPTAADVARLQSDAQANVARVQEDARAA